MKINMEKEMSDMKEDYAHRIMDEGVRIQRIKDLMAYLEDFPMVAEVVCIKGVIAEVKFHLDREQVTQKYMEKK